MGLVKDWKVSSEPFGSDHRQIRCTLEQIQTEKKWGRNPRPTNWAGYRADLESQLKNALNRFYSKEDLELVSKFSTDARKDSFEMNCTVKLKNSLTHVPWWNKQLSTLRNGVRKLFNRARNTSKMGDWEGHCEAQRTGRKAIVITKRNSCKIFCEDIENVSEALRLHKILSQKNSTHGLY